MNPSILSDIGGFGAATQWLLSVAALLLAGWLMGEIAARLRLPRVVGYALAGGLFGILDRQWTAVDLQTSARLFGEIGLGVLLFDLGRRVDFSWLRRDRTLALTAAAEMLATFGACYGLLTLMDVPRPWAAVAAAIAMSTAPAVVISVVRDVRAQGQVTERLLWLTAANTVMATLVATVLIAWLHAEYRGDLWRAVLHPLYLVLGSAALAALVAAVLSAAGSIAGVRTGDRLVASLGAVLLTLALARGLGLSVPLSLLALGLLTHDYQRQAGRREDEFGELARPLVVLFFVYSGTSLARADYWQWGWLALALIAVRMAAKWLAVGLVARLSGLGFRHSFRLGLALAPMSGLSLMLVVDLSRLYPEAGSVLAGTMMTAIALLEVVGPLATHFALVKAGEAVTEEGRHG